MRHKALNARVFPLFAVVFQTKGFSEISAHDHIKERTVENDEMHYSHEDMALCPLGNYR